MAKEYPDIETDYSHVDAICMWMVKNPEWFDVIVTDNMFGDIITDLGAMVQGGMGIAAGANINPEGVSMFEPIGGSAPKYTGQGDHQSQSPLFRPGRLCWRRWERRMPRQRSNVAVEKVLRDDLKDVGAGKMGYSTSEVGDLDCGVCITKNG